MHQIVHKIRGRTHHQLQNPDVATAGEDQVLGNAALHLTSNKAGDASNVVAVLHHTPCNLQSTLALSSLVWHAPKPRTSMKSPIYV